MLRRLHCTRLSWSKAMNLLKIASKPSNIGMVQRRHDLQKNLILLLLHRLVSHVSGTSQASNKAVNKKAPCMSLCKAQPVKDIFLDLMVTYMTDILRRHLGSKIQLEKYESTKWTMEMIEYMLNHQKISHISIYHGKWSNIHRSQYSPSTL